MVLLCLYGCEYSDWCVNVDSRLRLLVMRTVHWWSAWNLCHRSHCLMIVQWTLRYRLIAKSPSTGHLPGTQTVAAWNCLACEQAFTSLLQLILSLVNFVTEKKYYCCTQYDMLSCCNWLTGWRILISVSFYHASTATVTCWGHYVFRFLSICASWKFVNTIFYQLLLGWLPTEFCRVIVMIIVINI